MVEREGPPSGSADLTVSHKPPRCSSDYVTFEDLTEHNVKGQKVRLPLGAITAITGVSGSGKSSLMEALYRRLDVGVVDGAASKGKAVRVHLVDQRPIGKTPRSTVASYLGLMDGIRKLFAASDRARELGLGPTAFSLNVPGGRCETCQGTGLEKVSYRYLPDTYIECPECHGRRFSDEVLSVRVLGMTITDVLDAPVSELADTFLETGPLKEMLGCVCRIGLGYLTLGQTSMSLSGGEAQRIKLARTLGKRKTGSGVYFLDEPTSGLEQSDASLLSAALLSLADEGETVILTEHDPRFIAETADYVIDLGVGAGPDGGRIACTGSPQEVFSDVRSSWSALSL